MLEHYLPDLDPNTPKARKRARILRSATELFISNGFRKTSMDDVARSAHVAKGTLYLYFPNKADLLLAAVSLEKAQQTARLAALFQDKLAGAALLRAWLLNGFLSLLEMPLTQRMLSGDREILIALEEVGDHLTVDAHALQLAAVSSMINGLGGRRRPAQQVADTAQVLIALMYSVPALFDASVRGKVPPERYARALVDALMDGIAGPQRQGEKP